MEGRKRNRKWIRGDRVKESGGKEEEDKEVKERMGGKLKKVG